MSKRTDIHISQPDSRTLDSIPSKKSLIPLSLSGSRSFFEKLLFFYKKNCFFQSKYYLGSPSYQKLSNFSLLVIVSTSI